MVLRNCLKTLDNFRAADDLDEDEEPFAEKLRRLTERLREQQEEAARLDATIATQLASLHHVG